MHNYCKMYRHAFSKALALAMMLLCSVATYAQIPISGTVTDNTGEPMIGAAVKVKGTEIGAQTDIDGVYHLQAKVGQTLVVSYVGYLTQEVKISGSTVDIVLKENAELLEHCSAYLLL